MRNTRKVCFRKCLLQNCKTVHSEIRLATYFSIIETLRKRLSLINERDTEPYFCVHNKWRTICQQSPVRTSTRNENDVVALHSRPRWQRNVWAPDQRRIKTDFSFPQVKATCLLDQLIAHFWHQTPLWRWKACLYSPFRHFAVIPSVNGGLLRQFRCLCSCTPVAAGLWKDCAPLIMDTEMFASPPLYTHL